MCFPSLSFIPLSLSISPLYLSLSLSFACLEDKFIILFILERKISSFPKIKNVMDLKLGMKISER